MTVWVTWECDRCSCKDTDDDDVHAFSPPSGWSQQGRPRRDLCPECTAAEATT